MTRSVGGVLALALARELSPVVTAIIMAGRVGSAFAAELGTMQVSSSFYHLGPLCSHNTPFSTSVSLVEPSVVFGGSRYREF